MFQCIQESIIQAIRDNFLKDNNPRAVLIVTIVLVIIFLFLLINDEGQLSIAFLSILITWVLIHIVCIIRNIEMFITLLPISVIMLLTLPSVKRVYDEKAFKKRFIEQEKQNLYKEQHIKNVRLKIAEIYGIENDCVAINERKNRYIITFDKNKSNYNVIKFIDTFELLAISKDGKRVTINGENKIKRFLKEENISVLKDV